MKVKKPRVLKAVRAVCNELPTTTWFPSRTILERAYEKPYGRNLTKDTIPTFLKHLVREGVMERRPTKQLYSNGRVHFVWEYRMKEVDE